MGVLRAATRELLGFFVGDLSLTIAMLAWVALIALLAHTLGPATWQALLLFLGLAGILIENVSRASRNAKRREK
jgi:hypothetical protein